MDNKAMNDWITALSEIFLAAQTVVLLDEHGLPTHDAIAHMRDMLAQYERHFGMQGVRA